ncbi:MAG: phytoene desaturase, partial [Limisphaerales bacterium]
MNKEVIVIGSGFAGLSAAAYLAKGGCRVTILEKNEGPGGRASMFKSDGFTFDMGPSWYWMPDVFQKWFGDFGKKVSDYYDLRRVDPSYRVWFGPEDHLDIPAKLSDLYELFEDLEPGSSPNLKKFLDEAAHKYEMGINDLVHKPGRSLLEFADPRILTGLFKLDLFKSYSKHVDSLFTNDRIKRILEFPVYFLGATPQDTPALYTLMSYADLALGTWYPMGGMHEIVKGMVQVCVDLGVRFEYHSEVKAVEADGKKAKFVVTDKARYEADVIVAGADYHHIEQKVLEPEHRQYSEKYWQSR